MQDRPFKIFSGSKSRYFAEKVCNSLDCPLGNMIIEHFADGEFAVSYEESIRGKQVFLIQSTFPNSDNLMELLLMVDAAKRASAKSIVAVIPYFGWARQDRKDKPRVSIGAKLIADMLSAAGINRLITMDLHADQIQGFFDYPVDHLFGSSIFAPYIKSLGLENITVAAPDIGGSKRANAYSKYLNCEMAMCYKVRKKANVIESMTVIGEVAGKNIILIDDMIDTGGTLCKAADLMMERGALSVRAICTHPVLSGNAIEKIENSSLVELIVTDSIPLKQESSKIKVLSCADVFSKTIKLMLNDESISSQFIF